MKNGKLSGKFLGLFVLLFFSISVTAASPKKPDWVKKRPVIEGYSANIEDSMGKHYLRKVCEIYFRKESS